MENKCTVCGSNRIHKLYGDVSDQHNTNIPGHYDIWICDDCGLYFINPMLSNDELGKCYKHAYYSYQKFDLSEKVTLIKRIGRKLLNVYTNAMLNHIHPKPTKILDVGCGSGAWLWQMKKKGYICKGCEISKEAAELGQELTGIGIHVGALTDGSFDDEEFDYIRSNHSFEHINNPNETVQEMYRILKRGGHLVINVPNTAGLWSKRYKEYWYYLGAPIHVYNYSPKCLCLLLEKHGFTIKRVAYCGNWQGICGSIQIKRNNLLHNGKKSNEGFFFRNRILQLVGQFCAKVTNILKEGDCIEILAVKNT